MSDPLLVVTAFFERLWNGRELELAESLIHPNCRTHQLRSGNDGLSWPRGPEAMQHHIREWVAAFPDLRVDVKQHVACGDRVATHCTMTGTHEAPWMGIPPTHRRIQVEMMVIHRLEDGLIAEDWAIIEAYGFFEQLGVLPHRATLIESAG